MCYYRGIEKEQRMSKNRRRPHRGRREKKKKAGMLSNIILIVALAVFCVSAFQLVKIVGGYAKGRDEYKKIQSIALNKEDSEPEKGFSVDFDELKGINPDTVGWIRFYPEPSIINYPIVQTTDNEKYLHKTFSENDNTLGTIFLNADNNANFNDRNSIIYGHRIFLGSKPVFLHLHAGRKRDCISYLQCGDSQGYRRCVSDRLRERRSISVLPGYDEADRDL